MKIDTILNEAESRRGEWCDLARETGAVDDDLLDELEGASQEVIDKIRELVEWIPEDLVHGDLEEIELDVEDVRREMEVAFEELAEHWADMPPEEQETFPSVDELQDNIRRLFELLGQPPEDEEPVEQYIESSSPDSFDVW